MNDTAAEIPANEEKQTLLIVDDEPANLAVLTKVLQPCYRVRAARSGEQALRAAATSPQPNLILLDIMMPEMDGFSVLAKIRENSALRDIPVLLVTALSDELSEERGLETGAVDYITKPIKPSIVLARVKLHLDLKAARDALASQNSVLEKRVAERTDSLKKALETVEHAHAALKKTYFSTLLAISAVTELRGGGLGEHCRRVADLSRQLAQHMNLPYEETQDIFVAALLHDIGMIGFSDNFLTTPISALSQDQLIQYYGHPSTAAMALRKVEQLADIADIIHDHHEHFDGRGFPSAKSGLAIPIGARIIAAASDYDDLRHGKLTGRPLSAKQSFEYLLDSRGTRYDPRVVDLLEGIVSKEYQFVISETLIAPAHLQEGMTLTRDVTHPDGFLLLSKNTVITRSVIDQLCTIDRELNGKLRVYVALEPAQGYS